MSQEATETLPALEAIGGSKPGTQPASVHDEVGRGHGLSFIFWLLEQSRWVLVAIPTAVAAAVTYLSHGHWLTFVLAWLAVPLCTIVLPILYLVYRSWQHDAGAADHTPYLHFNDAKLAARWAGKKIPMEILYEAYMAGQIDFKQDLYQTLLRRNQLFRFCFTWGDVKFYFNQFILQNLGHGTHADKKDIVPVYDRGNDFYNACLGDTMVFTSGLFQDPAESLEAAQARKLEMVCRTVQMKPGDKHLDIGCGWGPLITYAAEHYGTHSTGVTLAKEQAEWAVERARKAGVSDRVRLLVGDYRDIPAERYDKITSLEMAEHVGIKNFQKMLLQVRSMLKDDGIFYLQIAGLRREWQYEDFVWGLFMGKYIFPGADASCPLGFVVNQCERAGFEVHRVENCGVHYSHTIMKWYQNWQENREAVVKSYGERWYRLWLFFLAWSVI
ncbi:MAG TPA: cyclopropane-fatty-acyl-phospholipid synthase family protein, partial [Polyangiales bacterium]|nr:cyclopropane-fatty-acyl-phospholipid synthase family protein [Polyangiales bacterium]